MPTKLSPRRRAAPCMVVLVSLGFSWYAGCAAGPAAPAPKKKKGATPMKILLKSKAFEHNGAIPKQYTGEGADRSPSLEWSGLPDGTKELALIVDDPDAPTPQPWVHWVVYGIAPAANGLPEGVPATKTPDKPAGAVQGRNSFGKIGYGGPYPPKGHGVHHYHFRIYALNAALSLEPGIEKSALLAAMKGHVLAEGELVGTYRR